MGTQGIVSVVRDDRVMFKVVAGVNGFRAAELAARVRERAGELSAQMLLGEAVALGFGSPECLVVQSDDGTNLMVSGVVTSDLDALYCDRDKFADPRFNPRWSRGEAEYTEVVNVALLESPFQRHREKVMGHYGTSAWLRGVVMAMWNGTDFQVGLSKLTGLDQAHFSAFVEMTTHYHKAGENDPVFMQLAEDVKTRLVEERRAAELEEQFSDWLYEVADSLRVLHKPTSLAEDRHEWLRARFKAGASPTTAAAECQPLVPSED
jgi:hypothetical protein